MTNCEPTSDCDGEIVSGSEIKGSKTQQMWLEMLTNRKRYVAEGEQKQSGDKCHYGWYGTGGANILWGGTAGKTFEKK